VGDALIFNRDALSFNRDAMILNHGALVFNRGALISNRNSLIFNRDARPAAHRSPFSGGVLLGGGGSGGRARPPPEPKLDSGHHWLCRPKFAARTLCLAALQRLDWKFLAPPTAPKERYIEVRRKGAPQPPPPFPPPFAHPSPPPSSELRSRKRVGVLSIQRIKFSKNLKRSQRGVRFIVVGVVRCSLFVVRRSLFVAKKCREMGSRDLCSYAPKYSLGGGAVLVYP
jgi:hypothetical protein